MCNEFGCLGVVVAYKTDTSIIYHRVIIFKIYLWRRMVSGMLLPLMSSCSCSVFVGVLALLGGSALAIKQCLPVFVQLQLCDHHLGGMNGNGHGLAVHLVSCDTLHMDAVLLAVHLGHLALTVAEMAPHNDNLIIPTNWNSSHSILGPEVLAQRGAHDLAADVRWRSEVRLAVLSSGGRDACLQLHGCSAVFLLDASFEPDYSFLQHLQMLEPGITSNRLISSQVEDSKGPRKACKGKLCFEGTLTTQTSSCQKIQKLKLQIDLQHASQDSTTTQLPFSLRACTHIFES